MGRTKGSKNKSQNTNTAKNKNIININVNSSTKKKGRGRPRRTNDTPPNRNFSGGGIGNAPQQVIVSQPQPDNNNNLLSSFITSKILNDTMSLNRTNIEPSAPIREQPSYFNARESIIPKYPDTPVKSVINEVKPSASAGPPEPPIPPPFPPKTAAQKPNLTNLSGMAAVLEEIKYNQSEEGQAEKARRKAEAAAKKESKKLEKETAPPKSTTKEAAKKEIAPSQSTAEFLNMSFSPPKKDIVEMMTPQKEKESTAIVPFKENKSMLDFVIGGATPKRLKTPGQQLDRARERLKELSTLKPTKLKDVFEFNDLKTQMTGQPNPNEEIGSSIINRALKGKIARNKFKEAKENFNPEVYQEKKIKHAGSVITKAIKSNIARKDFQEKVREKRKEYTRIIGSKTASQEAKDKARERYKINDKLFKPKSGAGRPKSDKYKGLKQTEL